MDSGPVPIAGGGELEQVRRQARQVRTKALVLAVVVTGAILLVSLSR